jgi:hypothetical protein
MAVGFGAMQTNRVLAQSPSPSPSASPSAETAEQKAAKAKNKYRQQNDVLYYGDVETCSTSPAATVPGAGGDCKGEPLPDTIPEYWRNLIDSAAAKYPDTDRRAVAATLWIENRGWPDPNKNWATSSAGASGPWQFIPSSWSSMGVDCNGDGKKNVNDPEDAVCAAFVHLKGTACKPLLEGATGDADGDYANVPFERDGNNTILSAIANYNGSGTRDGVPLAQQGRGQNPDYVRMAYWLISSGFTQTVDLDNGSGAKKDIDPNTAGGGPGTPSDSSTGGSGASCSSSSGGTGKVVQIDGFNYAFPLLLGKNDVVHAGDTWPCPGQATCHHDGTPAFDLFKKGRGPATEGTPVLAITDGEIARLSTRNGDDACKDWQLVGKDGWQYWYGHSTAPSVQNGSTVTAGQQIASVGKSHCADNTDPHLHIDRGSPKGHYGGSICCRDPGFIPLLNEIHERMEDSSINA